MRVRKNGRQKGKEEKDQKTSRERRNGDREATWDKNSDDMRLTNTFCYMASGIDTSKACRAPL